MKDTLCFQHIMASKILGYAPDSKRYTVNLKRGKTPETRDTPFFNTSWPAKFKDKLPTEKSKNGLMYSESEESRYAGDKEYNLFIKHICQQNSRTL